MQALAAVVRELRREAARLKSEQSKQQAAKASVT